MFEPLALRDEPTPALLVIVRLGANTLTDTHLGRSISECHQRWGIWGFSVLEVPNGDFDQLARLRPASPSAASSSSRTDSTSPMVDSHFSRRSTTLTGP